MTEPQQAQEMSEGDCLGDRGKDIPAKTLIDHSCALSETKQTIYQRLTTIICTIGNSSCDASTIEKMMGAGMNVALLSMAQGNHEQHIQNILNINKAVEFYNKKHVISYPLAIIMDLAGPEIRTGRLKGNDRFEVEVVRGAVIMLTTDRAYVDEGTVHEVFVDYDNIINLVKHGDTISFDKGRITLNVESVGRSHVNCIVECGGMLESNMLVHFPGKAVDFPTLSVKDIEDIEFGLNRGVDMICASYIRTAVAVHEIRELLGEKGKNVMLLSKIENMQGMQHLDEIIAASDGIMVIRGKLAIEMSPEKAFSAQRSIIARCNKEGKPVIVATQLLESTMTKLRPTRSEVTDVANAIISGTDCVVLAGETAIGEYPVESVLTMAKICEEAEAATWHTQLFSELVATTLLPVDVVHAVAIAAVQASYNCMASAIVVISTSGRAAHLVSRYRPRCPILSVTRNVKVARQNQIYRGIMSVHFKEDPIPDWLKDVDNRIQFALMLGQNRNFIKFEDPVVIIHGWKKGAGFINTMRVMQVKEPKELTSLNQSLVTQVGSI